MLLSARSWIAGLACALLGASACDPEPVGANECRAIEYARCDAALACNLITDVDACHRYYRDHCLHGLPTEKVPEDVDKCVGAIQQAGQCAQAEGADAAPSECSKPKVLASAYRVTAVCDLVQYPQRLEACEFLGTDGAAGAAGARGE